MSGEIWAIGETAGGALAGIGSEIGTLVRELASSAGRDAVGVVVDAEPASAAETLAGFVPEVLSIAEPETAANARAALTAGRIAALAAEREPSFIVLGATPDGRDLAGMLSVLLGWGILTNATALEWDGGPVAASSIFGGKTVTRSRFTGERGIVTVRPKSVTASEAGAPGHVTSVEPGRAGDLPPVKVVERVEEPGAAVSLEEARVIIAGGRGVGSPEGFGLVHELADVLGGAVGATRAAVDAGWIPYVHQIGQTGKIVRPSLYVALGVSGAIQHKVGMQTAETIVAINRDPDAPIAEFADMFVVGDLFEVVPRIVAGVRERTG